MMALRPIARSHRIRARTFPVNLPGHRIGACLGKAALKTHALQTLTRPPLTWPRARSVWSASDLSALSVRRGTASGSWPQCTISESSKLSMSLVVRITPASDLADDFLVLLLLLILLLIEERRVRVRLRVRVRRVRQTRGFMVP